MKPKRPVTLFVAFSPESGSIVVPAASQEEFAERLKQANYMAAEGYKDEPIKILTEKRRPKRRKE